MSTREVRSRQLFRQIIADEKGLRWQERGSTKWQTASWQEVSDFYLEPPDTGKFISATRNIIEFRDGRTLRFSALWGNYQAICGMVESHAKVETARRLDGTIGWELIGTRPADLPVSFAYSEDHLKKVLRENTRNILLRSALLVGISGLSSAFNAFSYVFPALMGVVLFPFIADIIKRPTGKQLKEARRRIQQGERWEATRDTLTLWQNGEPYAMSWTEIIGYDEPVFHLRPDEDTVRIRTVSGKEFAFTSLIEGAEKLAKMLPLYAREAVAYRRGKNEQQALGDVSALWTGGDEGKGDRIFHQRTRTNRNAILLGWAASLFPLIATLFLLRSAHPLLPFMALGIVACLIAAIPRTLRYFRDRLILGKNQLQIWQNGKEIALEWREITNLQVTPLHLILESKSGTAQRLQAITLTPSDYAYGNELPDLIREYVKRAKAEAERTAVITSDFVQPQRETRAWGDTHAPEEPQHVAVQRER